MRVGRSLLRVVLAVVLPLTSCEQPLPQDETEAVEQIAEELGTIPAPTVAVAAGDGQVTLSWYSFARPANFQTYVVALNGRPVAFIESNAYTALHLTNGTAYQFSVSVYDTAGNWGTRTVTASPVLNPSTPPPAPNVRTFEGNGQVTLDWSSYEKPADFKTFYVARNGTIIQWLTGTSYVATGLTNGTTYSFIVQAYDQGNLATRSVVTAIPGRPWTPNRILDRPFGPRSAWNTPIPEAATYVIDPEDARNKSMQSSPQYVLNAGSAAGSGSYAVTFTDPAAPVVTVAYDRVCSAPQVGSITVRVAGPIRADTSADKAGMVVDLQAGVVYDFFNLTLTGTNAYKAASMCKAPLDGTGFGYALRGGLLPGNLFARGRSAAGSSVLGGLITGRDIARAKAAAAPVAIDHALAACIGWEMLYRAYVPPSVGYDQYYSVVTGAANNGYKGAIPMGARFAIAPEFTAPPAGLNDLQQAIWWALKRYGLYVVDACSTGKTFGIYTEMVTYPGGYAWSNLTPIARQLRYVDGSVPASQNAQAISDKAW